MALRKYFLGVLAREPMPMKILTGVVMLFTSCAIVSLAQAQDPINPATSPRQVPMSAAERANLHWVLDWWRQVVEAGHLELVPKYQAESYIQHNPNRRSRS